MAKKLSIGIAADTGNTAADVHNLVRDIKEVEKGLEHVSDSLDDLSIDGDKGVEKLEKSFSEAQREISRSSTKIEKDLKTSTKKGVAGSKESFDEFKREANSTARESAASFDGSADSVVGAVQEVAANALGGFGPAGALAGLVAAAGIGAVSSAFTEAGEDAEALAEKTKTAFDQMIASKSEFIALEFISGNVEKLLADTEEMSKIAKEARAIRVSEVTMLRARAGDTAALSDVQNALQKTTEQLAKSTAELEQEGVLASESNWEQVKTLDGLSQRLEAQRAVNATATQNYRLYTQAATDLAFAHDVNLRNVDNLTDGVERLGSGLRQLPSQGLPAPRIKAVFDFDEQQMLRGIKKHIESHPDALSRVSRYGKRFD